MLLTAEEIRKYLELLEVLPPDSPQIPKIHKVLREDKKERCKNNLRQNQLHIQAKSKVSYLVIIKE